MVIIVFLWVWLHLIGLGLRDLASQLKKFEDQTALSLFAFKPAKDCGLCQVMDGGHLQLYLQIFVR